MEHRSSHLRGSGGITIIVLSRLLFRVCFQRRLLLFEAIGRTVGLNEF